MWGAAIGQAAMSALGPGCACSPRPSPPTVHCLSQCPPIVRTANVLGAHPLPYRWSSRPLRCGGVGGWHMWGGGGGGGGDSGLPEILATRGSQPPGATDRGLEVRRGPERAALCPAGAMRTTHRPGPARPATGETSAAAPPSGCARRAGMSAPNNSGAWADPPPPPTRSENVSSGEIKLMKGAREWRAISGTQPFLWPQTPPSARGRVSAGHWAIPCPQLLPLSLSTAPCC